MSTADPGALARAVAARPPASIAHTGIPLDQNPAAVYLAGLAPGSRRSMRRALDVIARLVSNGRLDALSLDWSQLRYTHTQAVRAALAQRYAPASVNQALSALRRVLKEAWRLGQMDAEASARAADLRNVRGSRLPKGRALWQGEIESLFRVCQRDPTAAGVRDAALLGVLYGAGLRRAEVVALELADFDATTAALTVRGGKGNKDRIAYAENGASTYLVEWILERGSEPGALFCPVNKGGRVEVRPMSSQAVWDAVQKRAAEAGVAHFSPHDLRRTWIGDLLEAGADIAHVQQLAGHASVTTTARYDRRPEAARRRAAGLLHVPYLERESAGP